MKVVAFRPSEGRFLNGEMVASKRTLAGVFVLTLATLMYEILLTRIFSATMWYHFAFVAISVAMFGMTVGAITIYLLPNVFAPERAKHFLTVSSLLFAVSTVLSFLIHLCIPFFPDTSLVGLFSVPLTYLIISVPFMFSGIAVCLALTRFPRQVSSLYAADLLGAAFGCILLIYALKFTDALTAVFGVALLGAVAALLFSTDAPHRPLYRTAVMCGIVLFVFVAAHTILVNQQRPLLRLVWVNGWREERPVYEKWNSFSRLRVMADPQNDRWMNLIIDTVAATPLLAFDGDLDSHPALKNEVMNICHYLRRNAEVLIVGTGAGKDVLSALLFDQKSVLGVEMNEDILNIVNRRFGDFTGHLDRNPRVTFVNDEARSYVTRSKDRYDIIQISLIDTWAATAAGAFVLSENSLYTVEAWKSFLEHLKPNGVLTVCRWYFRDRPGETYRIASLAGTALRQMGVANPRDHIMIIRDSRMSATVGGPEGLGTILVCRSPFSSDEINLVETLAKSLGFEVVLTPRYAIADVFAAIVEGKNLDRLSKKLHLNVTAPTDDSPFFFHMLRLPDVFRRQYWQQGVVSFNMQAVAVLAALLATVFGLTLLCIIVPLLLTTKKETLRGSWLFFLFFAAIGFGFMLIEISQLQRLIIFLGHPIYGLSVVLFALLLSSGLGSSLTQNVQSNGLAGAGRFLLPCLLGSLMVFGLLTPGIIHFFQATTTPVRILTAVGLLFPIGLFMGMAFPLGMKLALKRSPALGPWLWGINGATSVCASVLAVVISLTSGISNTFWTGFACYAVALLAFLLAGQNLRTRE